MIEAALAFLALFIIIAAGSLIPAEPIDDLEIWDRW